MSESITPTPEISSTDISRRSLLGGLALGAGAIGIVGAALPGNPVQAAGPGDQTEALDPTISGLVYLPLDAFAFDIAGTSPTAYRLYQETTGMQPQPAPAAIRASSTSLPPMPTKSAPAAK